MTKKLPLLLLSATLLLTGCSGGKLDTDSMGNAVGGDLGTLIKGGGHALNAASLSEKDENDIGQSVGVSLIGQYGLYKDDAITRYVTLVGLTVANSSPRPDIRYVFGILNTQEINAFSGPNGYIFITYGALAQCHDEAELAGVLAHEISHVCHHDGLKQIKTAEAQAAISDAAQASPAAQFSALADLGVDAITKTGYSQPQEFAADKSAVDILVLTGYDPTSYLHFMERIAAAQKNAGSSVMSTHPAAATRVLQIDTQIHSLPPGGATLAPRLHQYVPFAGQ